MNKSVYILPWHLNGAIAMTSDEIDNELEQVICDAGYGKIFEHLFFDEVNDITRELYNKTQYALFNKGSF